MRVVPSSHPSLSLCSLVLRVCTGFPSGSYTSLLPVPPTLRLAVFEQLANPLNVRSRRDVERDHPELLDALAGGTEPVEGLQHGLPGRLRATVLQHDQPDGAVLGGVNGLPGPAQAVIVNVHADDIAARDAADEPWGVVETHCSVAEVHCPEALNACGRPAVLVNLHPEVDLHMGVADVRHHAIIYSPAPGERPRSRLLFVVLIQPEPGRDRVAQRAQGAGGRGGGVEAVAAEHVEVRVLERGKAGDVLVPQLVALGAELGDGGVDVLRGPEDDGVEDQAERAELVLSELAQLDAELVREVRLPLKVVVK